MQLCFGDFVSRVKLVVSAQSQAYIEALGDSLVGQAPSRKKDLKKFLKSGFLAILQLMLAIGSQVEAPVARFTQNVSWLLLRLARKWTFQPWKYLDKFFKICQMGFWRLELATIRDSFQSWKTCVLHNEGYFQGSF